MSMLWNAQVESKREAELTALELDALNEAVAAIRPDVQAHDRRSHPHPNWPTPNS